MVEIDIYDKRLFWIMSSWVRYPKETANIHTMTIYLPTTVKCPILVLALAVLIWHM